MDFDPVEELHARAADFARLYARLVESLIAEGVPEADARQDAANAALQVILMRAGGREPWDR